MPHLDLPAMVAALRAGGVENPALDARLIAAHVLACDRTYLLAHPDLELSPDQADRLSALIARRAARESVGRLIGLREFWGLPFGLNEATLEPRPDSETLIEAAEKICVPLPQRILDLGTGTGCLLLALLHDYPDATGLGIDKAPRAVEQARLNAERLDLGLRATFKINDWVEGLTDKADLIVSNPPYIPSTEIETLQPEVRLHDPMAALDGGADGLGPYRFLIPRLPALLAPQGRVIFEVGIGQAPAVAALMAETGFTALALHKDLGGVERCVSGLVHFP